MCVCARARVCWGGCARACRELKAARENRTTRWVTAPDSDNTRAKTAPAWVARGDERDEQEGGRRERDSESGMGVAFDDDSGGLVGLGGAGCRPGGLGGLGGIGVLGGLGVEAAIRRGGGGGLEGEGV